MSYIEPIPLPRGGSTPAPNPTLILEDIANYLCYLSLLLTFTLLWEYNVYMLIAVATIAKSPVNICVVIYSSKCYGHPSQLFISTW